MEQDTDRVAAMASRDAARSTRDHILDVAERLYAEQGFGVSVRAITAEAGVNLAAISYHFGSKDKLALEAFRRRAAELNRERLKLLHEAEARHGGDPPLRDILSALLAPSIRWRNPRSPRWRGAILLARAMTEGPPEIRELVESHVEHLQKFLAALSKALPHLPFAEVCWRLHFTMGVLHSIVIDRKRLETLSGRTCDFSDTEALLARALDFAVAGFRGNPAENSA